MNNNNKNLKITLIKGIWRNLTSRRKKQLIILPILITFAGIAEMFSIASVIPFCQTFHSQQRLMKS